MLTAAIPEHVKQLMRQDSSVEGHGSSERLDAEDGNRVPSLQRLDSIPARKLKRRGSMVSTITTDTVDTDCHFAGEDSRDVDKMVEEETSKTGHVSVGCGWNVGHFIYTTDMGMYGERGCDLGHLSVFSRVALANVFLFLQGKGGPFTEGLSPFVVPSDGQDLCPDQTTLVRSHTAHEKARRHAIVSHEILNTFDESVKQCMGFWNQTRVTIRDSHMRPHALLIGALRCCVPPCIQRTSCIDCL